MIFAKERMPILPSLNALCKLFGSISLFLAVGGVCYISYRKEKEELLRIDSLIAFVKYIREQIDRYLTPLSEILKRCDGEIIEGILIGCDETAIERGDRDALRRALSRSRYYCDGGEEMDRFLLTLGGSFHDEEVLACDDCLSSLVEIKKGLSSELPKKNKSRTVLLFCLSFAVVILLL